MPKRLLIITILLVGLILPSLAVEYSRLYLPGYYPMQYNQIDIYKINNGLNFNKTQPYLLNNFGTTSTHYIDFDSLKVIISTSITNTGNPTFNESIYPDVVVSFDSYFDGIKSELYHRSLILEALTKPNQESTQISGLIRDISIDLPNIAIPKSIRKILGNKAGVLNLDGTQRITVSGTSTKRKIIPIYETNRGSQFELKMQQDTNLRLSGSIGEKIIVNLKYNSNQEDNVFDPNNINIKYNGDEDEIVQSIEAGNIALSLSGSRYISYSTSSQGLFGITSKLKLGALDVTMIASKEEGQKNTQTYIGQSQADSVIVYSKDFTLRTSFFLEKPLNVYSFYESADTLSTPNPSGGSNPGVPRGWVNNAIKTASDGAWFIAHPELLPKNGTVRVYMDDGDGTNNDAAKPGVKIYYNPSNPADTTGFVPYYDELIEGTDFVTNYNIGTIEIFKQIDRIFTIAATFTRTDESLVPANYDPNDTILHARVIKNRNQTFNPANPDDPYSTWDYQMRNIYSMGLSNIKKDDFRLEVYTLNTDNTRNYNVPDSLSNYKYKTFNDYLNLDTSGDGVVNGDDVSTVNLATGYITIPFIKPFFPLGDTEIYQDDRENITYEDFNHYISIKGKIGRDIISLGQTGVLKGSVKVKVNGSTQKENSDYIVDYDMGQITFLTSGGKDPNAKIEIDYEFRSGFVVSQKSLAGIRADLALSEDTKIGGTVIYRSESVNEKRPKIGSENMQLFMVDLDGSTAWKPGFITRWLDALPIMKTNAESRISLSGEIAMTIPNISGDDKHKKEAYVDDMEGILDAYPMGLSYSSWVMGSKPYQTSLAKGRINWYAPIGLKMIDVYGDHATASERDEAVTVLAMKVFPNTMQMPGQSGLSYAGIMKYIGNQLDFSNKKYIELLVKVDKYGDIPPNMTMHVDLGDISEDFYTDYGGLNKLNTEDKEHDGEFTLAEDVGLDGIADGLPGEDPNDNAVLDEDADANGDYPQRNGTEGNKILDTEDLDNNGVLNQLDRYLSYSTSITNLDPLQNPNFSDTLGTKYVLFRIPLNDPSNYEVINNSTGVQPTLKKISYIRLWVETDKTARVLIANASIVGNKWENFNIRNFDNSIIQPNVLNSYDELYNSGIADNQKTSHYTPPSNTVYKELGQATLEQSLTLRGQNLQQGHQALLRQRLIDYYNLLSYSKIRLWVYPEYDENLTTPGPENLDIVFRLGADSVNYYQVRQPIQIVNYKPVVGGVTKTNMQESLWTPLEYDMQDISRIKDSLMVGQELEKDGKFYSYYGVPTLTNVKEFVLGFQNRDGSGRPYSGTTYFDDIRVADPFEDSGWAGRFSMNSVFADFATLDVEYEQKSENFNPNIQRGRTQTFNFATSKSIRISNKYFIDKFLPEGWGLKIPLNLDRNYSITVPRFRANSDVLRSSIINPEDKAREQNENLNYSASLAISQVTTPTSPILQYTLNKMSLSGKVSQIENSTATTRDTTFAWQGTYNYNVNLPDNFLAIPLSKTYKLKLLPGVYTNNFNLIASQPKSYNWEKRDTLQAWFPRPQTLMTKTLDTDNGATWALLSDFSTNYRLMTKRDLMQKNYRSSYNIGKETEFNQEIGANYSPAYFPNIMTLTNSISSRYTENQRKYTDTTTGTYTDYYQRDGNSTRTIRVNMSLLNSNLFSDLAQTLDAKNGSKQSIDKDTKLKEDLDKAEINKDEIKKERLAKTETSDKSLEEMKADAKDNTTYDKSFEENEKKREELKRLDELKQQDELKQLDELKQQDELNQKVSTDSISAVTDTKGPAEPQVKGESFITTGKLIGLLAKVKNVTGTYQNGFSQIFTRKDTRPNYLFQLGLPHQVSGDFLDSRTLDDTYTLASGLAISRRIDTSLNYSYSMNKRFAAASNQSVSITFPDVAVTVSDLENWLGIVKFVNNTRLNSNYQYILRQTGDINWSKPKQETKTWTFNPLLSITTNIATSIQTSLAYTLTKTQNNTDMTTFQIVRSTNSQGLNGNISYSYKSSKGIKLPFTKKKINIKNELTSSLAIVYEKNYDTVAGRENTQTERNTSRISISPSATYQFDQNINGGLTSGYEITTDKKRDDFTKIFRLGIWVEITL